MKLKMMMMTFRSKNEEIISKISKETGYRKGTIRKIIRRFFLGVRQIMYRNGEISIKGLFQINLKPHYKRKVEKDPNINLRKREFPTKKNRKKK